MTSSHDSFRSHKTLTVDGKGYRIASLRALEAAAVGHVAKLPYSMKILLENLLRNEDGITVTADDIRAVAAWDAAAEPDREIAFRPARVLLQDFTGVPAVVDLAAMREAIVELGGRAEQINPLQPADLVIDHSVQVDHYGTADALSLNKRIEFERNEERYKFLRWGQTAFRNFRVVPPGTGIVHQVNVEYLAPGVFTTADANPWAYPDSLVGTDSHTTMVNGLGVLGWGVGGIEAEAAMLGQPIAMLVPQVVGMRLVGTPAPGSTATDVVLRVTEILRKKGVVNKFVEFFGPGLSQLSLADRATVANMAPEYGATMGFFPIDAETLRYLRFTGRSEHAVAVTEAFCREQGLFWTPEAPEPVFSEVVELDLSTVEPAMAGPKRPQDRVPLSGLKRSFRRTLAAECKDTIGASEAELDRWFSEAPTDTLPASSAARTEVECTMGGQTFALTHGAVTIAAITSCTNTSNPSVLLAAGLLAQKAAARGLRAKPWVKTSLAPGSQVVTDYLAKAGVLGPLEQLGFNVVGYGCTTCIGNSGPLPEPVVEALTKGKLVVASVLSGNRNFEGRVNPHTRINYLASPPLVVAYAIAGNMDWNPGVEPIGVDAQGAPVFLADIWPSAQEIETLMATAVSAEQFRSRYASVFDGDTEWRAISVPEGQTFAWDDSSTYIKKPPFFQNMQAGPGELSDIQGARVLALLGDSITTDHISPAGSIAKNSPAAQYLGANGVQPRDFNSYGARRGNHEVMMRGTFANIRLRNKLVGGVEGPYTRLLPQGEQMFIYDAAMRYAESGTPLMVIAGKEYGTGSSRDWAAKGTALLGVRAVLAESFERIHRSNLVGMGILPLQFEAGQSAESLGLTGEEVISVGGVKDALRPGKSLPVTATAPDGTSRTFQVRCRIDTPIEVEYYRHGGILPYVLRQLAAKNA
jgi:aconitate hydratase